MRRTVPPFLAVLACLSFLFGCGAVTKRPDIDDADVAAEAGRMYELVVGRDQQLLRRLDDLTTPLLIGNADLCGAKTRYTTAFGVANIEDYRGRRRDAMEAVYELDERIRVARVGREGPAHVAGLREGDIVLAVNDIETPKGMSASTFFRLHLAPLVEGKKPIKFTLLRKAEKIITYVQPVLACDYPVRLQDTGVVNAYATGTSIIITSALMNTFSSDHEVGVVLAHELAHNIMEHRIKKLTQVWSSLYIAKLLDRASGTNAGSVMADFAYLDSSVDYEYEADYVGLYLAARAGMDYELAPAFLRRLALDAPSTINRSSTHPKLAARYVAQEAAIAEIRKKTALGQPLIPEFKRDHQETKELKDGFVPERAVGK